MHYNQCALKSSYKDTVWFHKKSNNTNEPQPTFLLTPKTYLYIILITGEDYRCIKLNVVPFQNFISIPNCHDMFNNQHITFPDSHSTVSDKIKCAFCTTQDCLWHFYCAFASFWSLKASDLTHCNCIKRATSTFFIYLPWKSHSSMERHE